MHKLLASLVAALALGGAALTASAQPVTKVAIVDLPKVFDAHPKTKEYIEKLKGDEAKANEEIQRIQKEGEGLVSEARDFEEQLKNPALTDAAKQDIQTKGRAKVEEIQRKQQELQSFRQNTQRSIQQRMNTFRDQLVEEISKQAAGVAQKRGATLLLNKGAAVYFDPAYDITDEVLAVTGGTANAAAGTKPAAAAPAAGGDDAPKVTFPGAK